MNPYTLDRILRRGQKIIFRPRFTQRPAEGTVVAVHSNGTGGTKRVYIKYYVHGVERHQWTRPHRIFHVDPE